MEKYVIETWFRVEKIFDNELEAQREADNFVENDKHYKDTRFYTLKD